MVNEDYDKRRQDFGAKKKPTTAELCANFEQLFQANPLAMAVHDAKGVIIEANRKFLALYSVSREKAIGNTISELARSPERQPEMEAVWKRVTSEGTLEIEWQSLKNDKNTFLSRVSFQTCSWSGVPAILAAVRNITEEKRIERLLLESERRYTQLFQHMTLGFALHEMVTNDHGVPVDYRFLEVNPAHARITGLPKEMCVGRCIKELLPNIESYWIETFGRIAATGESITYVNYSADLGKHFEVTAFCPQLGQFAILIADATERVEQREALRKAINDLEELNADLEELNANLEELVRQRTVDLRSANVKLEFRMSELERTQAELIRTEKLASLGGLVAGVAHEISTPLGVGVTAASFLESSINEVLQSNAAWSADPSFKRMSTRWMDTSRIILTNLERAARLLKSFKQVSVDRESDPLRVVRLREYVDEVLISLNPMVRRSGNEAINEIPETLTAKTYPGALSQVLTNLVTNAIQHAFSRGSTGRMVVSAEKAGDNIRIVFSDNGAGIPDEMRPKIFDPFFTTRKDNGGSGLGLFIVQNLVINRLHGSVVCQAVDSGGTRFIISMPCELSDNSSEILMEK